MKTKSIGTLAVLALSGFVAQAALAEGGANPAVKATCTQVFEQQRVCSETFIPALVDTRVAIDYPAGIAQRAQREGPEALIAAARAEWSSDSTDSAIASTCEEIARSPKAAVMTSSGKQCLAEPQCSAFVPCIVSVLRNEVWDR